MPVDSCNSSCYLLSDLASSCLAYGAVVALRSSACVVSLIAQSDTRTSHLDKSGWSLDCSFVFRRCWFLFFVESSNNFPAFFFRANIWTPNCYIHGQSDLYVRMEYRGTATSCSTAVQCSVSIPGTDMMSLLTWHLLLLLLLCCDCCTLLFTLYIGPALYDCCCCSVLLLYCKNNTEVLLLRTGGAHPDISCVAPFWTYTHHGWLYCTGRIFDSIKLTSEGKSCTEYILFIYCTGVFLTP